MINDPETTIQLLFRYYTPHIYLFGLFILIFIQLFNLFIGTIIFILFEHLYSCTPFNEMSSVQLTFFIYV